MTAPIRSLGAALTVLIRAECDEHFAHADVDAYGAPSECHALVARGEHDRARQARRHAESIARAPMRVIARQAARRGMPIGGPRWCRAVSRVYDRTYPF